MIKKSFFWIFLLSFFIFNIGYSKELKCDSYDGKKLSPSEYDKVVEICNKEIAADKKILAQKKGKTLGVANEIKRLERDNEISRKYIKLEDLKLKRLRRSIGENKAELEILDKNIAELKKSLKKLLYKKYQYRNFSLIEIFLSSKTLSDFFRRAEIISLLEKAISNNTKKFTLDKKSVEKLMGELEERSVLEKELIDKKKIELQKIERNKEYKKELLGILKKEVGAQKNKISVKEKIKQKILRKKFALASGKKVTFGEAYDIIRPYEKVLGIDTAFVLAILFQESGWNKKIGGNIGACYYNQKNTCKNKAKNTVMSESQKNAFIKIMSGLGVKPENQKVSCPICRDGSYGGAMGPAQFMPTTWMMVRDKAAKIIGKSPSKMSPFTNHDAFIASGVLLRNNYYSKSCSDYAKKYKHISSERTLRERCAAAKYYAGGNWWKFRMTYGESVVRRANRFRADIKLLNE